MTRKHFIAIADTIAALPTLKIRMQVGVPIALHFAAHFKRFDTNRFLSHAKAQAPANKIKSVKVSQPLPWCDGGITVHLM